MVLRDRTIGGYKAITRSDRGLTYALVSDLQGRARQSCAVCHAGEPGRGIVRHPDRQGCLPGANTVIQDHGAPLLRDVWIEFGDGSTAKYRVSNEGLPELLDRFLGEAGVSCTLWVDGRRWTRQDRPAVDNDGG